MLLSPLAPLVVVGLSSIRSPYAIFHVVCCFMECFFRSFSLATMKLSNRINHLMTTCVRKELTQVQTHIPRAICLLWMRQRKSWTLHMLIVPSPKPNSTKLMLSSMNLSSHSKTLWQNMGSSRVNLNLERIINLNFKLL